MIVCCALAALLGGCAAVLMSYCLVVRLLYCVPAVRAELHVLDGAAQTIFVRANYVMEVRWQGVIVNKGW